jgi:cell shape-determining protein MreC
VALALGLVASVAVMLFPERWTGRMKAAAAAALRPGQVFARTIRGCVGNAAAGLRSHWHTVAQIDQSQKLIEDLREQNRRLAAVLEAERGRQLCPVPDPNADAARQLLKPGWIEARVLGRQAQSFLQRQHLLDVGSRAGVQPGALVADELPRVIDLGGDAGIEAGHLVASQGRVWGKVVEAGACTSVVRSVAEPGYRDVVRLAASPAEGAPLRFGPQGVLEGSGQPLARVRLVEATEPVAIGDLVYSETGRGILPVPLLYGRVVRLERPVGAAHWEIWMEPAFRTDQPERVAVLRAELNPLRVAAKGGHVEAK